MLGKVAAGTFEARVRQLIDDPVLGTQDRGRQIKGHADPSNDALTSALPTQFLSPLAKAHYCGAAPFQGYTFTIIFHLHFW